MKILAVDDDPSILEVLEAALSSLDGYDVYTAMSAAEGLEILLDHPEPFGVVLIDIQMPEMNGIEMCSEIRKMPEYKDTPLIIVTAMSQRSYISEAFRAGATDYVTKPFDLIDLRSRVGSAVRQSKRNGAKRSSASHALSDTLIVRNVTRFLGPDEYENYVMQVSQSLTSQSSVVAIKIVEAKTLHAELLPEDFEAVIQTVASSISVLTRQEGHMISYRGHGIFLCIRIGRYDVLPDTFEAILNRQIYASKPDSIARRSIKVCVGATKILKSSSKAGALDALTTAVESVEVKAERLADLPVMSSRVLSNPSRDVAHQNVERRIYSLMLKEVMTKDAPKSPFRKQSS